MRLFSRYTLTLCAALGLGIGAVFSNASPVEARDRAESIGAGTASDSAGRGDGPVSRGFERRGRSAGGTALRVSAEEAGRSSRWRDRRETWRGNDIPSRPRKWRDLEKSDRLYALNGGFLYALPTDLTVDDVYDGGGGSRFVTIDPAAYAAYRAAYGPLSYPSQTPLSYPSDTKIIDVGTERLDRRPVGPSGIEETYTGGAKIIRIAPTYERGAHLAARSVTDAARRNSDLKAVSAADLQPWSAGWLKHCTEAHNSFDPELGTYVAKDGRVRFCER